MTSWKTMTNIHNIQDHYTQATHTMHSCPRLKHTDITIWQPWSHFNRTVARTHAHTHTQRDKINGNRQNERELIGLHKLKTTPSKQTTAAEETELSGERQSERERDGWLTEVASSKRAKMINTGRNNCISLRLMRHHLTSSLSVCLSLPPAFILHHSELLTIATTDSDGVSVILTANQKLCYRHTH